MPSDVYEELVARYLVAKPSVLISPQFSVKETRPAQPRWDASIDFLAVDFSAHRIWMVEVTRGFGENIRNKIQQFEQDYKPRIEAQFDRYYFVRPQPDAGSNRESEEAWLTGLWVFAPEAARKRLDACASQRISSDLYRSTALEDILLPSNYADLREKEAP